MSIVFITGSARSGTTSLLQTLGLSKQTKIASEPEPNLKKESRELYDKRLVNPCSIIARDVVPRVASALDKGWVYIEKHVSFVPFIKYLYSFFNCKFIIPVRDGRDVVTSLINWHNQMFPIIYQECKEEVALGEHSSKILANQQGIDLFDYSLPRPPFDDPWFSQWKNFTRFEMVCWYWNFINKYLFQQLKELPSDRYLVIDYTNPTPECIKDIYEFIGLTDYNESKVSRLLNAHVNSLEDRIRETGIFPKWPKWSEKQHQRFYDIAFESMAMLGFTNINRPCPPGFGEWWQKGEPVNPKWYASIYEYRLNSHETFKSWFKEIEARFDTLNTVIDVGSGIGYGYADFFKNKNFTGIDLSIQAVKWSNESNANLKHSYVCIDIIKELPGIQADLVFSQGTIDNVYDMDAFLKAMAKMTKKILYIANYLGYFGDMSEHRYNWDPQMRVCFNAISAKKAVEVLKNEGFRTVVAFPMATHRDDIKAETVIVASRDQFDSYALIGPHEIYFDFKPYQVMPSNKTLTEIIDQLNINCAYYSVGGLNLVNSLKYFKDIACDLKKLSNRNLGTMCDLSTHKNGVNTAIRIDVDIDLVTGREMAYIAEKAQVPLSFYLLHTAPYYGWIHEGVFYRNEENIDLYLQLQQLGAEIGLHVDPLELYLNHNVDGAMAVKEELTWLRSKGIHIRGTSPHNCAPVYGAENFEIFKGRSINGQKFYINNCRYIPLGILDETELNLEYEASGATKTKKHDKSAEKNYLIELPNGDFLRDQNWFRTYILDNPYCAWGYHFNIWLIGKEFWVIAGSGIDEEETFIFNVPWKTVRNFISERYYEETIVLTLHPIYFGERSKPGDPPLF